MNTHNGIKAVIIAAGAAMSAYFGKIFTALAVLLFVMCADYISGIAKAYLTGTLDSGAGIRGIVKKAAYLLVAAVGMTSDWLFGLSLEKLGTDVPEGFGFPVFGLLVCVWLIVNELISILENIGQMGVPLPKFLVSALEKLRGNIEKK